MDFHWLLTVSMLNIRLCFFFPGTTHFYEMLRVIATFLETTVMWNGVYFVGQQPDLPRLIKYIFYKNILKKTEGPKNLKTAPVI